MPVREPGDSCTAGRPHVPGSDATRDTHALASTASDVAIRSDESGRIEGDSITSWPHERPRSAPSDPGARL
jgi:hypothetical protein